MNVTDLGVYVHIPFCAHRCHYCDFNTYEGLDNLHDRYVDALIDEIRNWRVELMDHVALYPERKANSVFFGGGTPTLLAPEHNVAILRALEAEIGLAPGAEITIEANPDSVDEVKLEVLRAGGFNRISFGVQSLAPHVLAGLGRTHSAETALEALSAARRAGFDDINADLIYGSVWEQDEDWRRSLDGVVDAAPDHVSAYALTIETGTPLATLVASGRVAPVDPDVQADRWETACSVLKASGFVRYEISNWAQKGHSSRHNLLYWMGGDYAAFGAGAHGHVDGFRWWRARLPRDYIAARASGKSTIAGWERLGLEERMREALMLGLRLTKGIDYVAFKNRWAGTEMHDVEHRVKALENQGLLEFDAAGIRLTQGATLVANDVMGRLL